MLPLLVLLAAPALSPTPTLALDAKEVRKQFVALAEKQDRAALVELWKANKSVVLSTIDRDLEASLSEIEKGAKPDSEKVKALHARALFGAECAAEASGHPILLDYTSSFIGWNSAQQKSFREGQKAFGAAGQALQKKDAQTALTKGQECYDKAIALGDWWGSAMGLDAIGNAQAALGNVDAALTALSQARLINHDLGLYGDELGNLSLMADLCVKSERYSRGHACAVMGKKLASELGDKDGASKLAALEQTCAAKLGK